MSIKIYTRKGDKGFTSLFGASKVEKDDIRVEAYGTVDEFNAQLGYLTDMIIEPNIKDYLMGIQNELFNIGSHLAATEEMQNHLPALNPNLVKELEESMDSMNEELPELKNFIIPGGSRIISQCHIVRTVCRRSERRVVAARELVHGSEQIIRVLNRLSDYFFVLARFLTYKSGLQERVWKK
jgi:cob(I)alamin adenosyltransferase